MGAAAGVTGVTSNRKSSTDPTGRRRISDLNSALGQRIDRSA